MNGWRSCLGHQPKYKTGNIVLLIDNSRGHYIVEVTQLVMDKNIHIMAMPPNTSTFIQPLDQLFLYKKVFYMLGLLIIVLREEAL